MKTVLGDIRRADEDFEMIAPGDRVAVGVSGGKDSLLLLYALSLYRKFEHKNFELRGVMLDMGFEAFDASPVMRWCEELNIPFDVIQTDIAKVVLIFARRIIPVRSAQKCGAGR